MERVKLYCAKLDDEWEDQGTGHFHFDTESEKAGFTVTQEKDALVLVKHEIGVTGQNYALQENSRIIRWTDSATETQHALSFEHVPYCKEVYEKLQSFLEKTSDKSEDSEEKEKLPELTFGNLEIMTKMFEEVQPFSKDQLFAKARHSKLVGQLVSLFQQCEDLEDLPSLENCCRIARTLVIHADFAIAEELFSEVHALHVIGSLEYDPDSPVRIRHREFLKERVRFKEVVPIADPEIIQRIHRVYRMQYVKDVVLPRLMDEPVFSCLSHMIMVGNMEIVNALSVHPSFFEELFMRIRHHDSGTEEWQDLVGFLQEYCQLMRQLQPANQLGILIKMRKLGLFNVLTDVLREGRPEVNLKVIDILNSSMAQDPSSLRNHITLTPKHPLFQLLLENLMTGDAMGLTEQSLEVIKSLMEPTEEAPNKYDSFLEIFYGKFVHDLVDALAVGLGKESEIRPRDRLPARVSSRAKGAIVDLLTFCVQTHSYTVKYFILRGNVIDRLLGLLKTPEKWLVASAIRFFRTLLGMKDEFYDRILQRLDVMGQIVEVFLQNGDRNNLLNSTILELFDFLRRERRHEHIAQLVEKYYDRLADVLYVSTFEEIKAEYEKKKEAGCSLALDRDSNAMSLSSRRMKRDSRALEKEEEDYFAEGSDDTDKMPDLSHGSNDMEMEVLQEEEGEEEDQAPTEISSRSGPVPKRFRGEESVSLQTEDRQRQT